MINKVVAKYDVMIILKCRFTNGLDGKHENNITCHCAEKFRSLLNKLDHMTETHYHGYPNASLVERSMYMHITQYNNYVDAKLLDTDREEYRLNIVCSTNGKARVIKRECKCTRYETYAKYKMDENEVKDILRKASILDKEDTDEL